MFEEIGYTWNIGNRQVIKYKNFEFISLFINRTKVSFILFVADNFFTLLIILEAFYSYNPYLLNLFVFYPNLSR